MIDTDLFESIVCTDSGARLDAYLSSSIGISRTRITNMIDAGLVLVNGEKRPKNYKLSSQDELSFFIPPDEEIKAIPQNIPLDIYYEDEHLIVVNKPQGMVVHPAPGNPDGTLVNALLYHCKDTLSGINGKLRPGIVHRIDKDTSGLLIVAKSDAAHIKLSEMFHNHSFQRQYEALVYGKPGLSNGTINLAIGRSKKDRKKMAFFAPNTHNTKNAVTHYRVIESYKNLSHVECTLETGRTHQIRVHMLSIGCPVVADPLYASGRKNYGLSGQCLHAKHIGFVHPISGDKLEFNAPLPHHFQSLLQLLKEEK